MRYASEHRRETLRHYVLHACGHTLTYDDSKREILDDLRLHRMSFAPCTYCEWGIGREVTSLTDDCPATPFAEKVRDRLLPRVAELIDGVLERMAEEDPLDRTGLAQRACLGHILRDLQFERSANWWLERRHYGPYRLFREKLEELRKGYTWPK